MKRSPQAFISLLIGLFLFTVLPMVGWGLNNLGEYFQNPVRLSYTVLMIIATFLVVIFVPNEGRGHGEGIKVVKRQKLVILFLQIVPIMIYLGAPYLDRHEWAVFPDHHMIMRYSGLALTFIGYFLMNWAVVTLDKQFSTEVTIQEEHQLITTGLYRYIRHPRYLGLIIHFAGISMVYRSSIGILLAVAMFFVLLWRIYDEEKLMHQEFGEAWETYVKKSWRMIPLVF